MENHVVTIGQEQQLPVPQLLPWDGKGRMTRASAMLRSDLFLGRLVRHHPDKILKRDDILTEPVSIPILEGDSSNVIPLPVQNPNEILSRRPTIRMIVEEVAMFYQFSVVDLCSHRRQMDVTRARMVAMWLCRKLTLQSLPTIGRMIGNRDHTTALNAARKIDRLLQTNERLYDEIHVLKLRIAHRLLEEAA